ncbi:glutamic-type intramembrane protease PrsW [Paenibacillus flagellatus]|uniref:Protease PrsW n=1 Tax=Paenibacillus flagellatus TaxID=2211139 RepID=A0A2V5K6E7_9BACL|nr:glutamic-type intramembrane protease PrsW [Paenibacillus flagellatus]PYI54965.1 PrsW family intramembrane metalloprotease [Paenibacillus flagellatus]
MEWLSVITAAVAPGIALLVYFYLKDLYDSEPVHMVARVFLYGVLLVFPTMVLQRALVLGLGESPLLFAFGITGTVEEFFKWFILYYAIYKHTVFDEPYDSIVYAVSVSLGFATLENVIYAMLHPFSFSALLFRALLPVSGHALFAVMMGYYMGKAKFGDPSQRVKLLFKSLWIPIFWHGLFDYILMQTKTYWVWLIVPLMVFLWVRGMGNVNRANAKSPFRAVRPEEEINL